MSSREECGGFALQDNSTALTRHSEQELVNRTETSQLQVSCVRQSASSSSGKLQGCLSRLDKADSACSVSVCQMSSAQGEGQSTVEKAATCLEGSSGLGSFVHAVHLKYQPNDDLAGTSDDIVIIHTSGNIKATPSGTINLPKRVSMSGQEISVAGDAACIQKMCANVMELDLMENNITSWDEVFRIIACIPHLSFLNLASNRLTSDICSLNSVRQLYFPRLTHLVLNNTGITWNVLRRLLEIFPRLVELHLDLNQYHNFGLLASALISLPHHPARYCYVTLRRLFFAHNNVTDWGEICKVGRYFPNLEYLLLSETNISSLGDPEDIPQCFPHLKSLGLGRTQLRSWDEVEKLQHFPALTDVRLSGVPFLEALPKDRRFQHTVALLPKITTLNGSKVTETEREDAERAFLRKYMDADIKPARYYELEDKYGRLDPLAKIELKPQRTVKIKVRVEDAQQRVVKEEEMDIELDQTVRALRKLLSVMAGRPVAKLALFYMDNQIEQGLERLIYLDRKLHSYGMTDGDGIVVAFKD
ncbi:hypothetical protein EGW08_013390 [Elysia chlorotica]|uniref:Ubiquitin-like domain-containing protein n=1 Tax=Elysia chlorotica TaxID=188477 RepID=A0A3S1B396_ELYCH|nr:hypothetical protein EGW08_013390 [Elysia chlorotica]